MCWSTHVMAYTCRDEQKTLWIQVSPFTFPCISGIKLPMPQFYDKRLYLLKPLAPSAPFRSGGVSSVLGIFSMLFWQIRKCFCF